MDCSETFICSTSKSGIGIVLDGYYGAWEVDEDYMEGLQDSETECRILTLEMIGRLILARTLVQMNYRDCTINRSCGNSQLVEWFNQEFSGNSELEVSSFNTILQVLARTNYPQLQFNLVSIKPNPADPISRRMPTDLTPLPCYFDLEHPSML